MQLSTPDTKKVHLITLGCARNRVDSEVMLGSMLERGWEMEQEPEAADAIVINTCGFIGPAKQESIDTILEAAEIKKKKPSLKIVVSGCLTQRYKSQLAKGLPEVDLFIGTDQFPKIADLVSEPSTSDRVHARRSHYIYSEHMPRVNTLNRASAYVKVSEGCQHNCSFCIIPAIRGKLRSRPVPGVVKEVQNFVEQGVKEVSLIAQDLAAYGRDLKDTGLNLLLKNLVEIGQLEWVRLLYMYPENVTDEFLEIFANEPKILKYIDIPIQHASDRILKLMNRQVTLSEIERTVQKLREKIPDVVIRTTVMTGFPSETDNDFDELRSFVKRHEFDRLGCFSYSKEEGTVAARLEGQVDPQLGQERADEIMGIQREISRKKLSKLLGKKVRVLVEGVSEESDLLYQGRMESQAPEVDGVVYINEGNPKFGEISEVLITETHDYDVVGKLV